MRFIASIDVSVNSRSPNINNVELAELLRRFIEENIKTTLEYFLNLQKGHKTDFIEISVIHINPEVVKHTIESMRYLELQLIKDRVGRLVSKNICTYCNCLEMAHTKLQCVGNAQGKCPNNCQYYQGNHPSRGKRSL